MKCSTCGNALQTRKVRTVVTGAFGKSLYDTVSYCAYCEWKGTTGAGKQLRELIKETTND